MAKNKDSMYYMKMCRDTLHRIYMLPPDQGRAFILLKRKARKYLALAKKLAAEEGK